MDTLGAVAGPATALWLLGAFNHHYRSLFAATLVPGLIAAGLIAFSSWRSNGRLSRTFPLANACECYPLRIVASSSLWACLERETLHTPFLSCWPPKNSPKPRCDQGRQHCSSPLRPAQRLYYAGFAFLAGSLADRFRKNLVLAAGYALAAIMAILVAALPANLWMLGAVFVLGGIYVGIEETLEDSLCAELVDNQHHGMAFGVLATVNGVGDILSSAIVGLLWSVAGTATAFGYSAALFLAGAVLVARLRAGDDFLSRGA